MRYVYQVVGNRVVTEANSLRIALEKLAVLAEVNSDDINDGMAKEIRKQFRIPTMVKVGYNITKETPNGEEVTSCYAIHRYQAGNPVPTVPTAP